MLFSFWLQIFDIFLLHKSVQQVDSFKYLWCNISSNLNCFQEVRIAIAKEAFNRKIRIFCGPLGKELRKKIVKCFVWSVTLYGAETWTLRRNQQKRREAFEIRMWRRMERLKWTEKIKQRSCVRKSWRWKKTAGTDNKEEKKLAGPLAKKGLPAEECSRRNGKWEGGSGQKNTSDNIQHHDKWTVCHTKRKAEKRVEWRMLSLQ